MFKKQGTAEVMGKPIEVKKAKEDDRVKKAAGDKAKK
jgi:hypothetical protein